MSSERKRGGLFSKIADILEMIKFAHSLFALPFALVAMLVAARGLPSWSVALWVVVACVAARSMAMAHNRLVDRAIDARNLRTRDRALATGAIPVRNVRLFRLGSALVFVFASFMLNPLCFFLSPVAILILLGYSHTKRFTVASHLFLGLALSVAPAGAWIAVRGSFSGLPVFLCGAVLFWTAGFDIIYACLDADFDRREGLRSLPARLGVARALRVSSLLHFLCLIGLAVFLLRHGLDAPAWVGLAVVAVLLALERRMVHPDDLSRVNPAFFTVNATISVVFLIGCVFGL
jgi:4-hydroxybenzoate polyprenyltransferase